MLTLIAPLLATLAADIAAAEPQQTLPGGGAIDRTTHGWGENDVMADDQLLSGLRPESIAVAAGRPARVPDAPLNQPIVPASTYVGAPTTDGPEMGYGRYGNLGWTALEDAIGALEGGRAVSFASGMAAAHALLELVPPRGVLVLPQHCYLGVASAARERSERHGLEVRTVSGTDTEAILAAADGADMIWVESPANPTMEVADIAAIAAGRPDGCLLLVDNTFATPILQRPFEFGADLVMHSATKLLAGHSDALCGVVLTKAGDDQHHQAIDGVRRLHGATPGSLEAYLVLRGIRTLAVRVRQAQQNAGALAELLSTHPKVSRVRYPGLATDEGHRRAVAQMSGFGSLLAIELAGAAEADAMVAALKLWVHATSLGGVDSSLERRRRWVGELPTVPEGLIRMSVGIEHVDDLSADLLQALDQVPTPR